MQRDIAGHRGTSRDSIEREIERTTLKKSNMPYTWNAFRLVGT